METELINSVNSADIEVDDGLVEGFGEIITNLYNFACSISLRLFNINFTLWDLFIAGCVVGLLAMLWHGLID